jgi:MFS family permease
VTLLFIGLVDELWSGVAVSGAPSVEHELALSHRGYVAFAFAIPLVVAAVLEAALALLSDVWGRARIVVFGQGALGAALLFTAYTASPWGLTFGLALAGASSGVACGAAQAALVASNRGNAETAMVRWSLYCAIGDVVAPIATASAIALGYSYRGAMGAVAILVCIQCAASAFQLRRFESTMQPAIEGEPPADALRAAFARAAVKPRLWVWLFAASSCTLLDELIVALAALRLDHDRAATAAMATAAAVTFSGGAALGAAITDRVVQRTSSRRVLALSAVLCAVALVALLSSDGIVVSCFWLFAVGAASAPHHALALAFAYQELPEYPGTVQALGQLSVIVDVGAPLALGAVADRYGLDAAMGCLLVQPLVVAACTLVLGRRRKADTAD